MNDRDMALQQQADLGVKRYEIGGQVYRLEPASYRQHRWLADGPMRGLDLGQGLQAGELQTLLQERGPEIVGMVLIAEGETRDAKVRAGVDAARQLGEQVECLLTPAEVRQIAEDFFVLNGWANWAFFIDFRKVAALTPAETMENGSRLASVSSLGATSPSGTA